MQHRLNSPVLLLLYGYPGGGKTFFARQFSDEIGAIHVSNEQLRYDFFSNPTYSQQENEIVDHLMVYMAEKFLSVGVSVVFDVNTSRYKLRRELSNIATKFKAKTIVVWVQIDLESAFTRVARRDRRRLDDKYATPLDRTSFEGHISKMQNPQHGEEYIVVSGKHTFNTQRDAVIKKFRETGLVDYQQGVGFVKPELVNRIPNLNGRVDQTRRNIVIR